MNKSRFSGIWVAVSLAAGVVIGAVSMPAVSAEAGLVNVARSQDLHIERTWSDSLPSRESRPTAPPEAGIVSALDEDEDVQRYVQMHEDTLDSPLKSFLLPWSTLQQIAN